MESNSVQPGLARACIILLTVATALIHIALAFQFPDGPDPIFILNGLGYLGLLALLYLPLTPLKRYRPVIRWVLMAYVALTLLLWIRFGARTPVAYLDKVIEVALITLLWMEAQQT